MNTQLNLVSEDVRTQLLHELKSAGLSATRAAKLIGVSTTTLTQWQRNVYIGDQTMVAERVAKWLHTRADLHQHIRAQTVHAHLAATADIIDDIAAAHATADCAVIYGRAGSGKTYALRRYAETRSGVTTTTMSPAITSPMGTLMRIARALGVGTGARNAAALEDVLVERLADRSALLAIDEAHHLTPALLDEIRVLHDRAGCGLALIGNEPLWPRLASSDRAAQLVSRVGIRRHLGAPLTADIHDLSAALLGRSVSAKEHTCLAGVGRRAGGFRAVYKTIGDAYSLARADQRDTPKTTDIENAISLREAV